jgi:glycosyltransferase involved in cell wall biosynthesis
MVEALTVQHTDLSSDEPDSDRVVGGPVYKIFWWRNLPLGARLYSPSQLPLSIASRLQLAAQFGAEQLAARMKELGAPHWATSEGLPSLNLSLGAVLNVKELLVQLETLSGQSLLAAQDISVVVCTRNRNSALRNCLVSLEAQRLPPGEILVVDNSPDGNANSLCISFRGVRYVHEPRQGLSIARNTGIRASSNKIVAFTDDDVEVHPSWTAEIARVFVDDALEAMTGLVLPACLNTPARRYFEVELGGFEGGYTPVLFESSFFRNTRPTGAPAWKVGAGANMAFRRTLFDRIGFFDERLGAGASGCSEDSELWYRLLANGGICQYEPLAVVYHHHRSDWQGLREQMRSYMKGHVSALISQYDRHGDRGNLVRIWKQLPSDFIKTFVRAVCDLDLARLEVLFDQVMGWLAGLAYLVRWSWRRGNHDTISR